MADAETRGDGGEPMSGEDAESCRELGLDGMTRVGPRDDDAGRTGIEVSKGLITWIRLESRSATRSRSGHGQALGESGEFRQMNCATRVPVHYYLRLLPCIPSDLRLHLQNLSINNK